MVEQPPPDEAETVATVAEILAAGLAAEATLKLIELALKPFKLALRAIEHAWQVIRATWFDPPAGEGPAGEKARTDAFKFRAWFLLNSARRLHAGLAKGERLRDLLGTEIRYAQQHAHMQRVRIWSARGADAAAGASNVNVGRPLFMWWTQQDERVSADCARRHGRIYPLDKPPGGIYPGSAHPHCRCQARAVTRAMLASMTVRKVSR